MKFRDTRTNYGAISKLLHWLVAILILCQFYWINAKKYLLPPDSEQGIKYLVMYHKPVGTILLVLVTIMILWRLTNIKPYYLKSMPAWEKLAAKIVQLLMYASILLMPLSGVLMTSYSGRNINMFGYFTIDSFTGINKNLAGFSHEVHEYAGFICFILIAIHTLAALKHHFYDKDHILKRMLPFFKEQ